ncbi:cytochrome c oxidase maturation protein [Candidatus Photodesmus blepharus]|uniref:Cytochrome c oxidase maturation protein n=1 Tax=Candidatus Photodesmus blepharonis TaxID=1179155 RepID=A0A084CNF7_9GAMM|nr:cbb3-type cytochrome oxidase assembly protein CcoS [Candidatus Photodesmus blepharus]KEY91336.1 cytochrome c oxidase maturation protein [Candidatus Photodesmus blepharus]
MQSLYILIPIAWILVSLAIVIFLWAVKNGQFEDLDQQGYNVLFDEHHNDNTENKK